VTVPDITAPAGLKRERSLLMESETNPTSWRPVLPLELWQAIFRFAAGEPDAAFDTSPAPRLTVSTKRAWTYRGPHQHGLMDHDRDFEQFLYRRSERFRLGRVCRVWCTQLRALDLEVVEVNVYDYGSIERFAKNIGMKRNASQTSSAASYLDDQSLGR
jgi:hypothetical protein